MLAAINLSVRGLPCGPPNRSSAVCMCRLARIEAITPMTRLRPSSIKSILRLSPLFRYHLVLLSCATLSMRILAMSTEWIEQQNAANQRATADAAARDQQAVDAGRRVANQGPEVFQRF